MQIPSDILVVGCGIAGLSAALACAESGYRVTIAAKGAGTIAISCDCIDLLGVVDGTTCLDPWAAMDELAHDHPYRILGKDRVREALTSFTTIVNRTQPIYQTAVNAANEPINSLVPTILGTFKPSYLLPPTLSSDALFRAERILVCGIHGLRDLSPKLCADTLKQHPSLAHANIDTYLLASPIPYTHRGLTALDIARTVNTKEGKTWLTTSLGRFANAYDVVLLPPILGIQTTMSTHKELEELLNAHVEELLTIPPGVGGIRLRDNLLERARDLDIRFLENTTITAAECAGTSCTALRTDNREPQLLRAKAYIIATGGILGGGITTNPDAVEEAIFRIPIPEDNCTARTCADTMGEHPICRLGVTVDENLHPIDANGAVLLDNVFFAGRTLGGYDYAVEKSGHGVAIATGWQAGKKAGDLLKQI